MDMKYVYEGEELDLFREAIAAMKRNDWETVKKIYQKIPISPETAMAAKKHWGAQYLIDGGYNLTWAEDKYGKDWLMR